MRARNQDLQDSFHHQCEELKAIKTSIACQSDKIDQLIAAISTLTRDNQDLKSENAKLKTHVDEQGAKIQHLVAATTSMAHDKKSLESANIKLKADLDHQGTTLQRLEEDNAFLSQDKQSLQKENADLMRILAAERSESYERAMADAERQEAERQRWEQARSARDAAREQARAAKAADKAKYDEWRKDFKSKMQLLQNERTANRAVTLKADEQLSARVKQLRELAKSGRN